MYVEPATSSFESEMNYLTKLEEQMASLGVSTLFTQKQGAETAESKRLSRTDSDSLLTMISKDMEACLQNAFEMAAAYMNIEAPIVKLDRDWDTQVLDGNQVGSYLQLFTNNVITHETLLNELKRGEVLPDIDVQEEAELVDQERLDNMMTEMVPGMAGPTSDAEGNEQRDEEVQAAAMDRMRRVAAERQEENDDDE